MDENPLPMMKRTIYMLIALTALLSAVVPTVHAQDELLREAVAVYDAAEFGRAIELLDEVTARPGIDRVTRREALQYLARAYAAERRFEDARRALDELLANEPPLVELDPEIENPRLIDLYYAARRDHQGYEVERADPGLQTLAVMDFANHSISEHATYDPLREGFASLLGHYLGGATGLQVVERERIRWLLDELALQRDSTVVDQESAVRAGKVLGAHAVLFGSYLVHGKTMRLGVRLVKVETSEVLLSEHLFGKPGEFFELIERLSLEIARAINTSLDRAGVEERRDTDSLDAMLAYSEGLRLIEEERFEDARARFEQALAHDPTYTRAERRIESLRPLLASR